MFLARWTKKPLQSYSRCRDCRCGQAYTGTLINNGGRTAWSSLKDAYTAVRTDPGAAMASAQEKVASVARAATTGETYSSAMRSFMEKMPTVQGAIDSAKSGGYNLAVGGKDRVVGSYKWASDTVGFHTMDAGTDLLTMARSGNANALHTYLAMKGWYNMTAGAHELRMQVNKETGENYTAIESLTTALTPDLVGENMSQTAWKSLMTAGELAFMVQLLRTGNLGKPVLGPNGLPAPSGYNPLNYLNATRRMARCRLRYIANQRLVLDERSRNGKLFEWHRLPFCRNRRRHAGRQSVL
ncbi:MAG: hypothetical protein R3C24_00430 [Cyanobacteriota/Melainabacteria group bacterium]